MAGATRCGQGSKAAHRVLGLRGQRQADGQPALWEQARRVRCAQGCCSQPPGLRFCLCHTHCPRRQRRLRNSCCLPAATCGAPQTACQMWRAQDGRAGGRSPTTPAAAVARPVPAGAGRCCVRTSRQPCLRPPCLRHCPPSSSSSLALPQGPRLLSAPSPLPARFVMSPAPSQLPGTPPPRAGSHLVQVDHGAAQQGGGSRRGGWKGRAGLQAADSDAPVLPTRRSQHQAPLHLRSAPHAKSGAYARRPPAPRPNKKTQPAGQRTHQWYLFLFRWKYRMPTCGAQQPGGRGGLGMRRVGLARQWASRRAARLAAHAPAAGGQHCRRRRCHALPQRELCCSAPRQV